MPSIRSNDQRLLELNRAVFLDVAEARPDTVAVDQLPDFLGHRDNADVGGCPHCGADNTAWLDLIHPNALGQEHIPQEWIVELSRMTAPNCYPSDASDH